MARRKTLLVNGETYHVFNRSAHKIPIFKTKRDYSIFLEAMWYYTQPFPPIRFSIYRTTKSQYDLDFSSRLVTVVNYSLMPNHFHFTLKQEMDGGIRDFVRRLTSSFAHYYNKKYNTSGPVFTGNFKAVRVEDEEQLVHLSRYIHLNPVTSHMVEKPEDYLYSSYNVYLGKEKSSFIDAKMIMTNTNPANYEKFVNNQASYQRELRDIKHLIIE